MADLWPNVARHRTSRPAARTRWAAAIVGALSVAALVGCGQVPSDLAVPPKPATSTPVAPDPSPTTSAAPAKAAPTTVVVPHCGCDTQPPTTPPSAKSTASKPATTSPVTTQVTKPTKPVSSKPTIVQPIPAGKTVYAIGSSGNDIRALQARLKQIGWFSGPLSDNYGPSTTAGVKGFQGKHNLTVTGTVDQSTWAKISAMTHQPSAAELTNAKPAGRPILQAGQTSDKISELQARLTQLDWFSEKITGYYGPVTSQAVKGFQGKHGLQPTGVVDQSTWDSLVSLTRQPTAAELAGPGTSTQAAGGTAGLDQRCLTGRAMCIDKTTDKLVWVIDGKPQLRFDVRFGADASPTREGAFTVGWKAADWTSTLYHSKMPYSMFFSGGQAVHYSSDFAARGYLGASHGCVNVRDLAGIQTLYSQAQVGDKVIVYRS